MEAFTLSTKNIVILGAGYGGLRVAKLLQKKNLDATITLVNKNDYHYEATYLHEVAAGTNPSEKITFPIKSVLNDKVNFVQATVKKIDQEQKEVILEDHENLHYDLLVVALGFESETFNIPGVAENSLSLVDIPTAQAAQKHLEEKLANYQHSKDDRDLTVVVCGAGFTSIEYLGELTHILPKLAEKHNFPLDRVRITCIEAMDKLLPMFPEKLSNYAIKKLEDAGVAFSVGTPIKEIKQGTVVYQKDSEIEEIHANTIIWTTGVRGSSVIEESGFNAKRGRVVVDNYLNVPENPEIFMIGDVSAVMDPETNRPYPTTAQIALKQADNVAKNIVARLTNKPLIPFSFKSAGTICSLGNDEAIAEVGNMHLKGYLASVAKKGVADKSLLQVGNTVILFKKGRFDFYH